MFSISSFLSLVLRLLSPGAATAAWHSSRPFPPSDALNASQPHPSHSFTSPSTSDKQRLSSSPPSLSASLTPPNDSYGLSRPPRHATALLNSDKHHVRPPHFPLGSCRDSPSPFVGRSVRQGLHQPESRVGLLSFLPDEPCRASPFLFLPFLPLTRSFGRQDVPFARYTHLDYFVFTTTPDVGPL
jgi:hypothetical protein